jgi:hypothetical protein
MTAPGIYCCRRRGGTVECKVIGKLSFPTFCHASDYQTISGCGFGSTPFLSPPQQLPIQKALSSPGRKTQDLSRSLRSGQLDGLVSESMAARWKCPKLEPESAVMVILNSKPSLIANQGRQPCRSFCGTCVWNSAFLITSAR